MQKRWQGIILILCLGSLMISLPGIGKYIQPTNPDYRWIVSQKQLYKKGTEITVKILSSSEFIGSGIIIERQENIYNILTNAHVLKGGNSPYQVQTFDGKIHTAKIVTSVKFGNNDLGLLQFEALEKSYPIAQFGSSLNLLPGEKVFVAGFSLTQVNQSLEGFVFRPGYIVKVLHKSLKEGYQIGYSNYVERGMSGGPLLNQKGELLGVNGKGDFLWETIEYYEDNSEPSPDIQKIIMSSGWAIPIETVMLFLL